MALPALPVVGLGLLFSSLASFFVRLLGRIFAGVVLQGVFGSIIFLGLSYYATAELGLGEYIIEKAGQLLTESGLIGSQFAYNFELGSVVSALRIVDSLIVIINGYFAALTVNFLKRSIGVSRA